MRAVDVGPWEPGESPAQRVSPGAAEQASAWNFRREAEVERRELCDDADGGLIGGASLKPEEFLAIIRAANQE